MRVPDLVAGHWIWSFQGLESDILFVGKGPQNDRTRAFQKIVSKPRLQLSWPRQIHSAQVLRAEHEGLCGDGDSLITERSGLSLSVVTADCVPIVIESNSHLATIHAGWRGLADGLIATTLEGVGGDPSSARAWIGPAIGVCCYEVGPEVADRVVATSAPDVLSDRQPRPHLDLPRAARVQLAQGGVEDVRIVPVCTRCSSDWLWSYRRDGVRAGRNWTFAWRR